MGTFVYDYPHHHLLRQLSGQVSTFLDIDSKPWLILGDLNELSSLDEKGLLIKVTQQDTILLIISLIVRVLLILVSQETLICCIINKKNIAVFSRLDLRWLIITGWICNLPPTLNIAYYRIRPCIHTWKFHKFNNKYKFEAGEWLLV